MSKIIEKSGNNSKKKYKILLVTGTRPEIIKMSVLIRLLHKDPFFKLIFVHSGQHYDDNMSSIFLNELDLPQPHYNMNIGSHPNSVQTAKMLLSLYDIVVEEKPSIILAQGDTNTVFASALTSFKNNIPFGHIEAGIRSYDFRMPEEINRQLTGVCALLNFSPTVRAANNLLNEGISPKRIFNVGNTVVDAVLENTKIAEKKSNIEKTLGIEESTKFILLTAHRPSNVDNKESLMNIINSLIAIIKKHNIMVIYPIHPRTLKRLEDFGVVKSLKENNRIKLIEPLGYLDFIKLFSMCYFVLTDSGGLQEEAVVLKKPCLTLRDNTERPESIEVGANILVGNNSEKIIKYCSKLIEDKEFYKSMKSIHNPFGAGDSSRQILEIIKEKIKKNELFIPYYDFGDKIPSIRLINYDLADSMTVSLYEEKNKCEILEIFDKMGNTIFPTPKLDLNFGFRIKIRVLE